MSNPAYQKRNPSAISRDLTSILAVAGLLLFSWFNLSAVQSAQAEQTNPAATSWIDDDNVSVRLISATNATGMADANSPLIFGLEFQLAENWKVYWRSPGDAGYPPTPDWALSKNVSRADIQWPAPVRFSILGFETLGYKHEVVYPISVIPERPGEAVKLAGEVDFLACADICIPMIAKLALELPSGEASPSSFAHLINKYSVRVPGNGSAHGLSLQNLSLYPAPKDGNPTLSITATSAPGLPFTDPDVFMEGPEGLAYSKPNIVISDDGLKATLFVEVFGAGAKDLTSDD
ncbi:MAG: hypothetical protein HON65_09530, partial [Rhodospirillales bacterium]|nr:hypothetical protein [Rhodospirillales bacterium]